MNVVLVGNGRSLLGRNLGSVIDSYDTVVRFNNFVTEGFESHVGSRTDWWVTNTGEDIIQRSDGLFNKIVVRLLFDPESAWERAYEIDLPKMTEQFPATLIEPIPKQVHFDLKYGYNMINPPLTGTVMLHHVLTNYEDVSVTVAGFDCMIGAPSDLRHYYSEHNAIGNHSYPTPSLAHDPDQELKYLIEAIVGRGVKML